MQDPSSPDRGLNPRPLHWEHGVLTTGPPGSPEIRCLFLSLREMQFSKKKSWRNFKSNQLHMDGHGDYHIK